MSLIPPVLPTGVDGQIIHDGQVLLFDRDDHDGVMQVAESWGLREGQGGMGITTPARGGGATMVGVDVRTATTIPDETLRINVYNENSGFVFDSVDFELPVDAAAPAFHALAEQAEVGPGENVGVRFTTATSKTDLLQSAVSVWFRPNYTAPVLPIANPRLTGLGAREDTSYGIWGSSVGPMTPNSVFGPQHGPRTDVGVQLGGGDQIEIWAVGFRAGTGAPDSTATIGVRNQADTYNLGTFDVTGTRHAQLLSAPIAFPSDTSISFFCEATDGPPMSDPVVIVWLRSPVVLTNRYYVIDDFYTTDDFYVEGN